MINFLTKRQRVKHALSPIVIWAILFLSVGMLLKGSWQIVMICR